MRSSACDASTRPCVRNALCRSVFPSAPALGSAGSEADRSASFVGLSATMAGSDFSCPFIVGYGSSPSRRDPATHARPGWQEISRFPREELEHMPGSLTTPGRNRPRGFATVRIAFQPWNAVGARDDKSFAAQWLAYASPCRRFAADLAVDSARLGAGAVRETFTVEDFHLMLLAGLPAHSKDFAREIRGNVTAKQDSAGCFRG